MRIPSQTLGAVLATVCFSGSVVSAQTLIAHYEFENSNNLGFDSSGNGNHMVSTAAPTQVAGQLGFGVSFNGENYLTDDGNDIMAGFDAGYSYAGWFQSDSPSGAGFRISSRTALGGFAFTDKNGAPRHIGYGEASGVIDSSGGSPGTAWEHVAVTINASGALTIYRNGVVEGTGNLAVDPDADSNDAIDLLGAGLLSLGARNSSLNDAYTGLMDDVRFYQGVLSQQDVTALYNAVPEPGSYALFLGVLALGMVSVGCRRR